MDTQSKRRTKYTSEFRAEAVAKCLEIGSAKACEELGIAPSTLHKWKTALEQRPQPSSDKPSYSELEAELKKLKREIGYVKQINEVLKKSTAIFSNDQMGGLK